MKTLKLQQEWLQNILPDGFPYPSSTLVSGPGGSGKPLVGYMFAKEWLEQGGAVVFLLTSTTFEYFKDTMRMLGIDIERFNDHILYIELDTTQKQIIKTKDNYLQANFVIPEIWIQMIKEIDRFGKPFDVPGVMVSGSALNLLFFSDTYKEKIQSGILETLTENRRHTWLFTVNSDAFKKLITPLEEAADNLMMSHMEKPMQLFLKIINMKGVSFKQETVKVPLSQEILKSLREEAEKGKRNLIPMIKKL